MKKNFLLRERKKHIAYTLEPSWLCAVKGGEGKEEGEER